MKKNNLPKEVFIKKFSIYSEKRKIKNLFHQIFHAISLAHQDHGDLENLVSVRYLLRKRYFTKFCTLLHSTAEGLQRCKESDKELIAQVLVTNKPCYHFCHAGLVDFAFPISIKSGPIPIIGGQLLFQHYSEKEMDGLLDKVKDLPLNHQELKRTLGSIPVVPLYTIKSILALVATILEDFSEKKVLELMDKTSGRSISKYEKLRQIITFLKDHHQDRLNLKEISKKFGLSVHYLDRIFRKEIGFSVIRYRNYLRLTAAKEILKNTSVPITQIAFRLGWNDSNYFSFAFKKETGFSPLAFRKSFQKGKNL